MLVECISTVSMSHRKKEAEKSKNGVQYNFHLYPENYTEDVEIKRLLDDSRNKTEKIREALLFYINYKDRMDSLIVNQVNASQQTQSAPSVVYMYPPGMDFPQSAEANKEQPFSSPKPPKSEEVDFDAITPQSTPEHSELSDEQKEPRSQEAEVGGIKDLRSLVPIID